MTIKLELPETIAEILQSKRADLPRLFLESLALEAYRAEILTTAEVQELLGYDSALALDGFLKEHEIYLEYTPEELDREAENSLRLWRQREKELQPDDRQRRAG